MWHNGPYLLVGHGPPKISILNKSKKKKKKKNPPSPSVKYKVENFLAKNQMF